VAFLGERMVTATEVGVDIEGIVLDPGPDFAKTPAQTIEVLAHLDAVVSLGRPVLLAVSRKDFVGALTLRPPRERDAGSLAAVADGVDRGASIVRVHDVAAVRDYFTVRSALRGDRPVDPTLTLPIELRKQPPD
jgi:dihydropteroate synthase